MKIIYSFWDKAKKRQWYDNKYQWYTLALSVYYSNLHYGNTHLITTKSVQDFIKLLEIPFTSVSTELEDLNYNPKFWIVGKIKAYQIQEEPFIHLDGDLILYEKPNSFEDILVEKLESFKDDFYKAGYSSLIDRSIDNFKATTERFKNNEYSYSMGVYGSNNLEINKEYCNFVFNSYEENKEYLESQPDMIMFPGLILEQYTLASFTDKDTVETLDTKYLHLTSDKYNNKYYEQIRQEVEEKLPNVYKNINRYV